MFARKCQKIALCSAWTSSRRGWVALFISSLGAASFASGADLSQAVVREKYNVVTVAPNLGSQGEPAAQGAVIQDGNVVRTGAASRAALEFSDLTQSRLGANSIFSFDAKARVMNFNRGAVMFSKPTNSGAIQLRSGAVTAAITGSTGFISTVPIEGIGKAGDTRSNGKGTTTLVGMLEGKLQGGSHWTDSAGREHTTPFTLGPGDLLVARPGSAPLHMQFDIPRFLKTSPLVKGFKTPLLNADAIDRAVAAYQADERAGFIERSNVRVSTKPVSMGLVGQVYLPTDVVPGLVDKNPGGFLPVGSTGIIRAQLVWNTSADLDLYLTLPTGQVVSFGNVSVTFNNGRANARLDQDNLGNRIDFPPRTRVENIAINGIPLGGLYRFFVNNFNASNGSDSFTLRVFYNGHLQLVSGNLAGGQNSPPVVVQVPHG
jgi:hypothetical protein